MVNEVLFLVDLSSLGSLESGLLGLKFLQVGEWLQEVLELGELLSPCLLVVGIVLGSVGWVVEVSSVGVDIVVPCLLFRLTDELDSALSAEDLDFGFDVLHVSLSEDSSIAVLSVVVSDLSLEPGVVLP